MPKARSIRVLAILTLLVLLAATFWLARERESGAVAEAPASTEVPNPPVNSSRATLLGENLPERAPAQTEVPLVEIKGRLVAAEEPDVKLAGVTVNLLSIKKVMELRDEELATVGITTTDETGRFRFDVHDPHDCAIQCEASGFRPTLQSLRPGEETLIVLRRPTSKARITGEVFDADGIAVENYTLLLSGEGVVKTSTWEPHQTRSQFEIEFEQRSDSTEVELGILAPGYRIGYTKVRSIREGTANVGRIVLERWSKPQHGVVVDSSTGLGVGDAVVTPICAFLRNDGRRSLGVENSTRTDPTGAFVVTEIHGEGLAWLLAEAPGYAQSRFDLSKHTPGTPVRIELTRGGTLEGRVVFSATANPRDFRARCVARDLVQGHADVNEVAQLFSRLEPDGSFRFANLADGAYELDLVRSSRARPSQTSSRTLVWIQAGRTAFHELTHGDDATLTVPLRGTSGLIQQQLVSAYLLDASGHCVSAVSAPLAAGDLQLLDVPPGSYELEVRFVTDSRFHFRRAEHVSADSATLAPVDLSDLLQRSRER
ncbi:MAG: carboxypeptidase regulatory-like domain-containing protein [Planctomycetaceae bacterium]|nr:carboxypeptidase regulatory-like domain-containing protein [Planctomycetaceae bacterium]